MHSFFFLYLYLFFLLPHSIISNSSSFFVLSSSIFYLHHHSLIFISFLLHHSIVSIFPSLRPLSFLRYHSFIFITISFSIISAPTPRLPSPSFHHLHPFLLSFHLQPSFLSLHSLFSTIPSFSPFLPPPFPFIRCLHSSCRVPRRSQVECVSQSMPDGVSLRRTPTHPRPPCTPRQGAEGRRRDRAEGVCPEEVLKEVVRITKGKLGIRR